MIGIRFAAIALAGSLGAGCLLRYFSGEPAGTCEAACDHYVACREDATPEIRAACLDECPQVLADRDSLMAFERLSCADALEFIEGPHHRPLGRERAAVSDDAHAQPGS